MKWWTPWADGRRREEVFDLDFLEAKEGLQRRNLGHGRTLGKQNEVLFTRYPRKSFSSLIICVKAEKYTLVLFIAVVDQAA